MSAERYVPATGRLPALGLYDRGMALTMRERRWRPALVEAVAADTPQGGTIVDVGAGTGTLAIALARRRPDARVVAIDGDPRALQIARAKPGGKAVDWREGLAGDLGGTTAGDGGQATPRPGLGDESVDAAVVSLLLHHLGTDAKRDALAELARVIKPGGALHVADWGRPHDPLMRAAFGLVRLADGLGPTRDHAAGRLPVLIAGAGFDTPQRRDRLRTAFGTLEVLRAKRRV